MQTLQCFSKSLNSIGINNFAVDFDISSTQKYTFARYMKGKLYLNLKCKILTRFLAGVSHVNFEHKEFAYLNITRIGSQLVRRDIECGFACLEITSCFSYNLAAFPDANGKQKQRKATKATKAKFFEQFSPYNAFHILVSIRLLH